jgi:hypothetical protein
MFPADAAHEMLKQIFPGHSTYTLLVNGYIHRYGGFDGFYKKQWGETDRSNRKTVIFY